MSDHITAWFDRIDNDNSGLEQLLSNPAAVGIVNARTKKSLGRVPDMPIMCAGHETGFSVSFTVKDGQIMVLWLRSPAIGDLSPHGITHVDERVPRLDFRCPACGRHIERKAVWVVERALNALINTATRRPMIRP